MTSNIGSDIILQLGSKREIGFEEEKKRNKTDEEVMREKIMKMLQERFKPEFLNRVDEITIFHALNESQLAEIVELQLKEVGKRLAEKKLKLKVSDKAKKLLAKKGYDPLFGARPLKRVIQTKILDPLALKMIEGKLNKKTIEIDVRGDEIVLK